MIMDDISARYKPLSSDEQSDAWLQRYTLVGSIFAAGLLAMVLAALLVPESKTVLATPTLSFQEQHALAHLEYLPVYPFEDLTFVFTAEPSTLASLTGPSSDGTAKR